MKNIGLKKGTVKILPHQDIWHQNFEKEKELILSLNNKHIKGIEHVGSTSIPNMPAKPIIDINIGIDNFYNAPKLIKSLAKIGYEFRLEPRRFQWLFVKKKGDKDTHYLKILRYKGNYWNEYQAFKEILLSNKKAFVQYKKLKLKLGGIHSINRKAYTKNKSEFIKRILKK
ncbi:GrpB family protein [Patescibacteria group bacterium]